MVEESKVQKLIQLCWSEYKIGSWVAPEEQENIGRLLEEGAMEELEAVLAKVQHRSLSLPFGGNEILDSEDNDLKEESQQIREDLWRKARESISYMEYEGDWMVADATVRKILISEDVGQIDLYLENVTDCSSEEVAILNVHMQLKEVQCYQIGKIEKGQVTEDNEMLRLHREYDCSAGNIQNDYYEFYEDGMYTLLILMPGEIGWYFQADYKHVEVKTEVQPRVWRV